MSILVNLFCKFNIYLTLISSKLIYICTQITTIKTNIMKIYKIEVANQKTDWDYPRAYVVVAGTKDEAILQCMYDGKGYWADAEIEEVGEYTGTETEAFILLSHIIYG